MGKIGAPEPAGIYGLKKKELSHEALIKDE
jgi:hypothetical protein